MKTLFYVLKDPSNTMDYYHLFLNVKDLRKKNYDVKIILEGYATSVVQKMSDKNHPLNAAYEDIKGSIVAVCKGCAIATKSLEAAEAQGLPVIGNLDNHVALEPFIKDGYNIIVF
ncbi:hypothetical protein DESAMIL20_1839 [Desulfurella amilsii]|uniref:Cytoplasmic protein n=1 Tax=Desulfurella amilsii TaxID=1562698 RepID=A0A1X4XXM3_9BACT|nr:hypothetical protein [Desulfurella amilsii]OSS42286.1 hypothetical protein DESAMIL20_1839 [Desulfurella amilsii]